MRTMMRVLSWKLVLSAGVLWMGVAPVVATADIEEAWSLMPVEARAAVVIPSVRRFNDDFTALMEGMDRANAVIGAKPMEAFLLNVGLNGALREEGAAAMLLFMSEQGEPTPLMVLPVRNPERWIEENFVPAPEGGGAYALRVGGSPRVYVRALERHIAFSAHEQLIAAYARGESMRAELLKRLPAPVLSAASAGEMIVVARPEALALLQDVLPAGAVPGAGARQLPFAIPDFALGEPDALMVAGLDFDPLGLGVRLVTCFPDDSPAKTLLTGGPRTQPALAHLPNHAFLLAFGVDLVGLGGPAVLERLMGEGAALPAWVHGLRAVRMIASPSVLGLQGGLLNEAGVLIETSDPAALRDLLAEQIGRIGDLGDGVPRSPVYAKNQQTFEGFAVDAFEVTSNYPPSESMMPMVESLFFGRRGFHGYIAPVEKHLLVMFSQRRDVFLRLANAATGQGRMLTEHAVLREMRAWLPQDPDIEGFIGVGAIGRILQQAAQMFPIGDLPLPKIDPTTKPVGFALDVRDGFVEAGAVIPADVAAILYDQMLQGVMMERR